jgi:hypothetical protein
MDVETIRRGRRARAADLINCPVERVRHAGGGRPAAAKQLPPSRHQEIGWAQATLPVIP